MTETMMVKLKLCQSPLRTIKDENLEKENGYNSKAGAHSDRFSHL